ncbi:MAG: hypothetical protein ACD_62C00694G0003 [uncultured bacterium]|nr:MAG: hypothetical protein ACD_62C00694G0003 [uncultured bacterium]
MAQQPYLEKSAQDMPSLHVRLHINYTAFASAKNGLKTR